MRTWTHRRAIAAALVAAGLLLAARAHARQDKPGEPPKAAAVPFEMLPSNHMMVKAKLNGKGPYNLIFDLGAPVTLLTPRAAEASGTLPKDAPRSFLFGMRGEGRINRMKVGELTAEDLPVIFMDHPTVKALGDMTGKTLDGIIGYTFFARYRTSIDYKAREMTFTPVDFEVRDIVQDLQKRMAGPKVARTVFLAPRGLWGLALGEPAEDASGVAIKQVLDGSPAAEAGLRAGDVLTTLDGRWTTSVADAYHAAAAVPPGQAVEVVVLRGGQEQALTVKPREGI